MARVVGISSHRSVALTEGWTVAATEPGAASGPSALSTLALEWRPASVPGTVASAERARKAWSFESKRNYDAHDWWYRTSFAVEQQRLGERRVLSLGGLASVAEVWVDGELRLTCDNMFVAHDIDVTALSPGEHALHLRFCSLDALLKVRRARPRWRTKLVEAQNLRWFRTSLMGRVPAFTPPVVAVGPYLPVAITSQSRLSVIDADVRTSLEGAHGVVSVRLAVDVLEGTRVAFARLVVGGVEGPLDCSGDGSVIAGALSITDAPRWWPHTHGSQPRCDAAVVVQLEDGAVTIDLGRVAFRALEVSTDDGGFALAVNGVPVFCRGACWTTADVVTLVGEEANYRAALELARDAGMNMLRIAGTNAYESDLFYELCDELGILVWQDFMFANMDYPDDGGFLANVRREVDHFLTRTQTRACIAVLCGGSEVEQQVAMLGLPRELWKIPLFREHIPEACRARRPDVPYCSSSPTGGALPFHVSTGVGHYYGVGAYLRPLEDARRAEVRFASECLAFANVPEESTLETFIAGVSTPQNVRWKERAPRDSGASWDFDDVRDHYLERLFAVDARQLRTTDLDRYLALSRAVTGEVMANVFGEWRRRRSTCRGGLVFAFQDFWAGAGFGVVDALGRPKAAYHYLKRALAKVALFASDEGSNGVVLHAINDDERAISGQLEVQLYRHGSVPVVGFAREWRLPPRCAEELALDQELDHFVDTAYAYRFGPPSYDVLVATLRTVLGEPPIAEAFFFPAGMALSRQIDIGLRGEARKVEPGRYKLTVTTSAFAQAVSIEAGAYVPRENWFHLAPGASRVLELRSASLAAPFSATLRALNAHTVVRVNAAAGR